MKNDEPALRLLNKLNIIEQQIRKSNEIRWSYNSELEEQINKYSNLLEEYLINNFTTQNKKILTYLIDIYYYRYNFNKLEDLYDKNLILDDENKETIEDIFFTQANNFFNNNLNYIKLINFLNKSNTLYPDDLRYFKLIEKIYSKIEAEQAILYTTCLENYKHQNYEQALFDINKLLEFDGLNKDSNFLKKDILYKLALKYYNLNDYEKSLDYINNFLIIDETNKNALLVKFNILYKIAINNFNQKDYEKSIKVIDNALEIDKNDNLAILLKSSSLYQLARESFVLKKFCEAAFYNDLSLELNNNDIGIYLKAKILNEAGAHYEAYNLYIGLKQNNNFEFDLTNDLTYCYEKASYTAHHYLYLERRYETSFNLNSFDPDYLLEKNNYLNANRASIAFGLLLYIKDKLFPFNEKSSLDISHVADELVCALKIDRAVRPFLYSILSDYYFSHDRNWEANNPEEAWNLLICKSPKRPEMILTPTTPTTLTSNIRGLALKKSKSMDYAG